MPDVSHQAKEKSVKALVDVLSHAGVHWVGDGFPVRTVFLYEQRVQELSPFLLLDYAGPHRFGPAKRPRGVGPHPHRGFETVTIVYEGEVAHRDSTGQGGVVGPGDVQWMTAGAGIMHQEFHSPAFTRRGGTFRVVQLWVNLPAALKLTPPRYQALEAADIPTVELPEAAGRVRVIAGAFEGKNGPAQTCSELNVWDIALNAESRSNLHAPKGHTTIVVVLSGSLEFGGDVRIQEAEAALLDRPGSGAEVFAPVATRALVLTGAPLNEPVFGRGPFVMNTEAEIRQAFLDFGTGRFGMIKHS
jgi:redox-sensitive bicupin YhaK (pirin superfamily)